MELKPVNWTYEQQAQFETARDIISTLQGILIRQSSITNNQNKKKAFQKRIQELQHELDSFDYYDEKIIKNIIETYSQLIRKYDNMGNSDEEISIKGLPEEFLTTKIDYSK